MNILKFLKTKYFQQNDPIRFVINAIGLALLWLVFYGLLRDFAFVNDFYEFGVREFTNFLLVSTEGFLNLFGYETISYGKIVKIVDTPGIYLDRGCLARNLMGLYVGFVLAYPGMIKKKLWFIPFGLIVIIILNIMRLGGMAMILVCCPEHVDINHHYVFKIVVFGAIFILWYFWIFKMNSQKINPEIPNTTSAV